MITNVMLIAFFMGIITAAIIKALGS